VPAPLLFDLDGTLVDSALGIAQALSVVMTRRGGPPIDAATVRPLVSLGASSLVAQCLGQHAEDAAADLLEFRTVLQGITVDPAILYPGAPAALQACEARGHPMAVVTNKPESLARQLLADLALTRFFPVVVGGDTLPVAKPHADPLRFALKGLRDSGEQAIMIGDSIVDAAAAAAAAMPFLLFEGGYGVQDLASAAAPPVAARFASFAQLPDVVAALASGALPSAAGVAVAAG